MIALAVFLAPGYCLAFWAAVPPRRLEVIPVAFGASFVLLTFLNIPLFLFHASIRSLVIAWIGLSLVLAVAAWHFRRRVPDAPRERGAVIVTLLVAVGLGALVFA